MFVPPRRRTGNGGSDQEPDSRRQVGACLRLAQGLLDESLDDDALFDRLHGHREQENGTRVPRLSVFGWCWSGFERYWERGERGSQRRGYE